MDFVYDVDGDDITGSEEVVKEPPIIGSLCHHLNTPRLVDSIILFQELHN